MFYPYYLFVPDYNPNSRFRFSLSALVSRLSNQKWKISLVKRV
ncbi:hypothetical protein THOB06_300036 [Vibrio rotiferianus]|nr:hypothetical protein THOG10_300036 [Vibrio rotiferianus]CAH1583826.1 hypothetical protein THOB06_300036 [Vibrio rotiferianus]